MSCLSDKQKRLLSQLSARAYSRQAALARGVGQQPDMSYKAYDEFRHREVALATGKAGLRCCSQDDYKTIEAHFYHLLGEDGRALNSLVREATNENRVWETKITRQLAAMGKPDNLNYAAGICKQMFHGLSILEASPQQLRKIYFALIYQHQRQSRKQKAESRNV